MTNTDPGTGNSTGPSDEGVDENDENRKPNLGSLNEDVAHPFDQTNGIVDGLEGNSDGTAEGEAGKNEDEDEDEPRFTVPSPRSAIRNKDES